MPRRRRPAAARLEHAGQLRLDFPAPWPQRIAVAQQLRLDLRPGVTLESRYEHWDSVIPNRVLGARSKLGMIIPVAWRLTQPQTILARLRRRRPGRVELAARMTPH